MRFTSGDAFLAQPRKAITLFGMSGVGKTTVARALGAEEWFHYSVDYRIGTRYMDEHIVDNFKREAARVPLLRELLRSDSIYIRSNLTFDNLRPLSTYLGKPGDATKGGLSFAEYERRQAQHRIAEVRALEDVPEFIARAWDLYRYPHFVCDTGGSLVEVVDAFAASDPLLDALAACTTLVYIAETPEHREELVQRFRDDPKPMYYTPEFLQSLWARYRAARRVVEEQVDPDDFVAWGFAELVAHRQPRYAAIAQRYGYTVPMSALSDASSADAVLRVIAGAIDAAK
jgi:hypothetical protein